MPPGTVVPWFRTLSWG